MNEITKERIVWIGSIVAAAAAGYYAADRTTSEDESERPVCSPGRSSVNIYSSIGPSTPGPPGRTGTGGATPAQRIGDRNITVNAKIDPESEGVNKLREYLR